jgi:hypothetical protein
MFTGKFSNPTKKGAGGKNGLTGGADTTSTVIIEYSRLFGWIIWNKGAIINRINQFSPL